VSSKRKQPAEAEQEVVPAWALPDLRDPRFSQSLERGLAILRWFTPKRPLMGIADIADELGMSRSTTHRYVSTLLALGYLEQGPSRKYRLGLRVSDLGMSALNATGLREHARDALEELRERTSYTASMAVLDGQEVVCVDRVRSFRSGQNELDMTVHTGSRVPAHATATGKLLLASLPERAQRQLIAEMKLRKRGPNTITSKKALREHLEQLTQASFAVNDEELGGGLYAVAARVRDEAGETVAAINVTADSAMISLAELVGSLGPQLQASADRISARLGYTREHELAGAGRR
jgi:IclR family transcriptional regulator, pca regulon regulatory protein